MSSIVPEGWEAKELGDIATFSGGSAFKEMYQGENSGKHPFIKVSDMNLPENNRYIAQANNWVSEEIRQQAKIKLFPSDSVVFAKVGAALLLNRRRQLIRETAIDNNMMAAIPNTCDHNFLYYSMQSIDLANIVQSGAVPSVNQSQMESIPTVTPPLPEQKKIASILTSVDEVIENTQKQIDKLQDLKKATMNELLTKGIGHTEFKDSELGRIPKSWEVGSLSNLITIKHGYAFEGAFFTSTPNGITLLTPGNFHRDGHLYFGSKTKYYTGEIPKDYILNNGDLLVVMTDLTAEMTILGNTLILSATNIILHNQRIGKIVFSDEDFHLGFLNLIMNSRYVKKFVKLNATGTTVRHTSPTKIMDCDVPIPSLSEQTRIASIISCIQENIEKQQEKLSQTQSLKKSLMQDLLTGKVRVTVN
jgi:type I restriction enzyme S subunit